MRIRNDIIFARSCVSSLDMFWLFTLHHLFWPGFLRHVREFVAGWHSVWFTERSALCVAWKGNRARMSFIYDRWSILTSTLGVWSYLKLQAPLPFTRVEPIEGTRPTSKLETVRLKLGAEEDLDKPRALCEYNWDKDNYSTKIVEVEFKHSRILRDNNLL